MAVVVVGVFGIMQLKFQQSFGFIIVRQILFIVRVLDTSTDTHMVETGFVSPRRPFEEFPFLVFCMRCSHVETWCIKFLMASYLANTLPVSGCYLRSTENYYSGDSAVTRSQCLARQVDTFSASVLGAFGRIAHFLCSEVDSNLEVFSLRSHAEWSCVLSRFQSWYVLLALGNLELLLRGSRGWQYV